MKISLTPPEARIIGVLIEKAITTPDQYPLSLNALVSACNQKSNRDPVTNLDEATVLDTLQALKQRYLVADQSGFGSRVAKYRHRFCNEDIGGLQLPPAQVAILCELLLRGPQTPGELRSRGERLHTFRAIEEVEGALEALAGRDEPLVERLPREPGKREARYRHRLGGEAGADIPATAPAADGGDDRLDRLEQELRVLRAEVEALRQRLEEPTGRDDG